MTQIPNRQYIRRQRFSRLRKSHGLFLTWLTEQAARLSVPARALRDSLLDLGTLAPSEVAAAADAGAAGVALSSAATTNFSRVFLPAQVGALATGLVDLGVDSGVLTVDFVDGGGGNDSIVRATGSWLADGLIVGSKVTITDAAQVGNNGTFTALVVTASTIEVATASLTADTGDEISAVSLNTIKRAGSGSFLADGFWAGGTLRIDGSGVALNDISSVISAATAGSITLATSINTLEPDSPADVGIFDQIKSLHVNDWVAVGIGATDSVYFLSIPLGVVDSLKEANTSLMLAADLPANLLGAQVDVGVPSAITRAAGDFTADGFLVGNRVRVASGPNEGDYTVGVAAALELTLNGDVLTATDAGSTDAIFRIAAQSRD